MHSRDDELFQIGGSIYNTFATTEKPTEAQSTLVKQYQHQLNSKQTPNDRLLELGKLPNHLLIYLLVEIKKMIAEDGCFKFENREKGCIKAYFDGLSYAFESLNTHTLSIEQIKKIHHLCTDPNVVDITYNKDDPDRNLQMKQFSGQFRSPDEPDFAHYYEYIKFGQETVSIAGLTELINDIENNKYPGMMIGITMVELSEPVKWNLLKMILAKREEVETTDTVDSILSLLNENQSFNQEFYHLDEKKLIDIFKQASEFQKCNSLDEIVNHLLTLTNKQIDQLKVECAKHTLNNPLPPFFTAENIKNQKFNYRNNQQAAAQLLKSQNANQFFTIYFVDNQSIKEEMQKCVASFNHLQPILADMSADEKLTVIFSHIKQFVLIHPFFDANNRVFVNILANVLLIQNGLPPAVYFNPFVFYVHSTAEIVQAVKLSCANYGAMVDSLSQPSPFSFYDRYTPEQMKALEDFTQPLRNTIDLQQTIYLVKERLSFSEKPNAEPRMFKPLSKEETEFKNLIQMIEKTKSKDEIIQLLTANVEQSKFPHNKELYQSILNEITTDKNLTPATPRQ